MSENSLTAFLGAQAVLPACRNLMGFTRRQGCLRSQPYLSAVFVFRTALSSAKYDPQPLAAKLYQKLFRQTSANKRRCSKPIWKPFWANTKTKL